MSESLPWLLRDTRRARKQGPPALAQRQLARLAEMVATARVYSPYYRELYQGLPERVENPAILPVTDKKQLMKHFDEWCTDREVTIGRVRAHIDDLDRIGEPLLGKYTVATTSGTTGTRGIFLADNRSLRVTSALALWLLSSWLDIGDILKILAGRGHFSMVMATGGHFATTVAAARLQRSRLGARTVQVLSVRMPLPEIVAALNQFQPVLLAPYASMAALLATEQEAGRLRIRPVLLALTAEGLPRDEYDRIARVFGATVGNSYAATECPFLSYSCEQGWLHVNSDWVIVEPVDAEYQPVPPGTQSHTVLISNLANQVQPILRYDLGDSVLQRPDPCPCGNPLPAIRVQGRVADMLTFSTAEGERVALTPLAFATLIDRVPGVDRFQIVQTAPASLRVRLRIAHGADSEGVGQVVRTEITRLLAEHGLANVDVAHAKEPPEQSSGGKYREVIPLVDPPGVPGDPREGS